MNKGYKLKYKDQWILIRHEYGEILYYGYDESSNPNVADKYPYEFVEFLSSQLKQIIDKNDYDKIQIVECGELSDEENAITIQKYFRKKRIR